MASPMARWYGPRNPTNGPRLERSMFFQREVTLTGGQTTETETIQLGDTAIPPNCDVRACLYGSDNAPVNDTEVAANLYITSATDWGVVLHYRKVGAGNLASGVHQTRIVVTQNGNPIAPLS